MPQPKRPLTNTARVSVPFSNRLAYAHRIGDQRGDDRLEELDGGSVSRPSHQGLDPMPLR